MRRLHPTRDDVRAATRVTVSVVVPMVVFRLAGHPQWVLYSTFAAFTSVYGRGESPRRRISTQLSVSVLLTGLIIAATATATADDARWWSLLGVSFAAAVATAASHRWTWRPAGALFAVFAFGAVSSVPATGHDVLVASVVAIATSAFTLLVGAEAFFLHWGPREELIPIRSHSPAAWRRAVATASAAGAADALATWLHLGHPYWAAVSAVVPMATLGTIDRLVRARHRAGGTVLGITLAYVLFSFRFSPWGLVIAIGLLQLSAELMVIRHYGIAMMFVTPLSLAVAELGQPQPAAHLIWARTLTTAIGLAFGLTAVVADHSRPDVPTKIPWKRSSSGRDSIC
ncbi:MAG: FUSC family protein [Acidimicrobiales bacterium]